MKLFKSKEEKLFKAVRNGNLGAVEKLLGKGTDASARDKAGWTPLHLAAYSGHREIADLLIANGADVNAKIDVIECTPLHLCAKQGHKDMAELLIAKGADVNAGDDSGWTPLRYAVRKGRQEVADLLNERGGVYR
jgi:ankyrin repeat protein